MLTRRCCALSRLITTSIAGFAALLALGACSRGQTPASAGTGDQTLGTAPSRATATETPPPPTATTTPPELQPTPPATTPPPAVSYPTDAIAYARAFVDAWRAGNVDRMAQLADIDVVNELKDQPKPAADYRTCGDGAAGSTYVRVFGVGGPEYLIRLSNARLGGPQAIVNNMVPLTPPPCS